MNDLFNTASPPETEQAEGNMKAKALDAIQTVSNKAGYNGFTCFDVKARYPEIEFSNPKTWGSMFRQAMRQGVITNTMTVRPVNDPTSHNRPQAVWKGAKFK